jgi:hypothetical protein
MEMEKQRVRKRQKAMTGSRGVGWMMWVEREIFEVVWLVWRIVLVLFVLLVEVVKRTDLASVWELVEWVLVVVEGALLVVSLRAVLVSIYVLEVLAGQGLLRIQ